jgi:hypothetical protein
MVLRHLFFISLLLLVSISVNAFQRTASQYDSSYYVSYDQHVTSRIYFSRKFTTFALKNSSKRYTLNYLPNTTLNFGVGATYKWFTLNLAYGFKFINPERGRGDTKYLDLQFHSYGRKIVLDVFGQFYKGFYLSQKEFASPDQAYYLRPDLRVSLIGTSVQYLLNHRQFSYRASFLQNEWQKKSAGSLLFGLEFYAGWLSSDSTLLPPPMSHEPEQLQVRSLNFFEFGPNVGYAHTFIIKKHFFITGSTSVSLDYGTNLQKSQTDGVRLSGFSPDIFVRFFGGYNSDKWAVSLIYIRDRIRLASDKNNFRPIFDVGNFRLNYVYRFVPGQKARKVLKSIDKAGGLID